MMEKLNAMRDEVLHNQCVRSWFVYLLECRNGKIYTGITTDVQKRFEQHLNGKGAKFTRANPPVQILAFKQCTSRSEASSIEYHVKCLKPSQKKELAVIWHN